MSIKLIYGRPGDGMKYPFVESPKHSAEVENDINSITLLSEIYQRLCSAESKIDDLLLYLKGVPADNQIQLRDAIMAHLSGDRTLIEEYVKNSKTH